MSGIDAGVLPQIAAKGIVAFVLVMGRVGPLFLLAPVFSSRMIPARVKAILAGAISLVMTPLAMHGERIPTDSLQVAPLMVKEVTIGLAFALAIGVLAAAVQAAGGLLDTLIGFSFGATVDPINGNQGGAFARLYMMLGTAMFIAIGGDAWMLRGISRTFKLVPLTKAPQITSLVNGAEQAFAQIFVAAIEVAAPVLLALLITDVAFGVVSRVVPQLNIFAVGFPTKVAVAMLVVAASLPFVANWIGGQLPSTVAEALGSRH